MFMRVNSKCAHQWSDVEPTVGQPLATLEELRRLGRVGAWVAQSLDVHRCGRFAAIHGRRASVLRDMSWLFRV
jgi:hypothetical protein